MSYEISLYLKSFLDRAIESSLGDWSDADPIPEAAIRSILDQARSEGFVGDEDSGFLLDSDAVLAAMHVYPGQIAFSIPYGSINLRLPTHGEFFTWTLLKANKERRVKVEGQLVFNTLSSVLTAAVDGFGLGRSEPGAPFGLDAPCAGCGDGFSNRGLAIRSSEGSLDPASTVQPRQPNRGRRA